MDESGRRVPSDGRHVGDEQRVFSRAQIAIGNFEQRFPAIRSEFEYRRNSSNFDANGEGIERSFSRQGTSFGADPAGDSGGKTLRVTGRSPHSALGRSA